MDHLKTAKLAGVKKKSGVYQQKQQQRETAEMQEQSRVLGWSTLHTTLDLKKSCGGMNDPVGCSQKDD